MQKNKETILSNNDDLGRLSRFPENISLGVLFRKINWFYSSWGGGLAFKKIRGRTWRPEDQFGGIWWWSEYQIFPKTWKSTSPMSCNTKPCQSSRESHRMVHTTPPDTPRPPKYHLKLSKNLFLRKNRFFNCSKFFVVFWPYRTRFWPYRIA